MDSLFTVEVISQTPNPQQIIYAAMHQDYSERFVAHEREHWPDEEKAGAAIVKNLLAGNRGHYGCYSADTEVLTESGWIRWEHVTPDMRLLAVNIQSGSCHFEVPSSLQTKEFAQGDKMYSVRSAFIDILVTQDHRMVVSSRQKSGKFTDWNFRTASDVNGKPVRYLLNSCLQESERSEPGDMPENVDPLIAMKMAGFFFGDGVRGDNISPNVIRFRLRRPRKIAYLMGLGCNVRTRDADRYTVENADLAKWIHRHFSSNSGKVVPSWLIKLPMNLMAAFWDGLKNSDGTRITEKSWSYDSCEKTAIDIIQASAHVNGFSANITLSHPNVGVGHENHRPCWRVCISEHATRRVEVCQKRSPGIEESLVDYEGKVYCATVSTGALLVRRNGKAVVCGNCLEHPQIVLNFGWFPHSTMQQMRTHRVGVSFDCQSGRYTGQRIVDVANGDRNIDEVFYLRPVGDYTDRQGKKYTYTLGQRLQDENWCKEASIRYLERIKQGFSEEHARGLIPFDVRQHWVMSANARSLMHILDLRWKADAQLECQQLCDLVWPHFEAWMPAIAEWYKDNRAKKARLSP